MAVIFDGLGTLKPNGANAVFAAGSDLSCSADTGYANPAVSASCNISLVNAASDSITVRCGISYSYMGNVHVQAVADDWTITIQYE